MVQMPGGVPVATVGIGNAKNAGLLAIRILGIADEALAQALGTYEAEQREAVAEMNRKLP
jgi:phosphoribosylaminoimidazole carboxylase PurE protein